MAESDNDIAELRMECDDDGVRFIITRIGHDGAEIMAAADMTWDSAVPLAGYITEGAPWVT